MLFQCPVEDCQHKGEVILIRHYNLEHDMTKKEVEKKYGKPKPCPTIMPALKKNMEGYAKVTADSYHVVTVSKVQGSRNRSDKTKSYSDKQTRWQK